MRLAPRSIVIVLASVGLALLHGAIQAATGSHAVFAQPNDVQPAFTQVVTITVDPSSAPITPALSSFWQTSVISFPSPGNPFSIHPPYIPADAYAIVVTAEGGIASVTGVTIWITITQPVGNFYYDFRTHSIALQGNGRFRVNQLASSSLPYRYISTVYFTQPYQFSGFLNETPTTVSSYTVSWDGVPPYNASLDRYRFDSSVWLADPRINSVFLPIVMRQN